MTSSTLESRILIVDDDEIARTVAAEALESQGYTVYQAASGVQALAMSLELAPDLVLLDVLMPGMSGYEVCTALRQRPNGNDCVIVMATGLDDAESIERSYEAGATDFIAKPLNLGLLRHRARYLLRARRDRKLAEERIARMAFYDELTGLPNRAFFTRHLAYVIEHAKRRQSVGAVLSLDLDGFKTVNDTFGHQMGDELLRLTAARLESCLRQGDCITRPRGDASSENTIARFGGDEFVIVLSDLGSMEDAAQVAHRIVRVLSEPFEFNGQDFRIGCSIGIAPYPSGQDTPEILLRNADAAMYHAKRSGGGNCQFYCDEMSRKARAALELESGLRHALERNEFELHYQPKVETTSGRVLGVEALIRWRSPTRGLISPLDFIPLAERTGLIVPIGDWVLRHACFQAQSWSEQGLPELSVAVNVSARQFRDGELPNLVRKALSDSGLQARRLELEITEDTLMDDARQSATVLSELRKIGVRIAIDDFGTGYSSLSYLRNFAVDTIKVDRSFVRDVVGNQDSAAITAAILAMTQSLRLEAVAEGVETTEQVEFLLQHGCPILQGFLFSRPLPACDFRKWLESRLEVANSGVRSKSPAKAYATR